MSNKIDMLTLKLSRIFFNNEKTMFTICHDKGFIVFNTAPFAILNNRMLGGSVEIAQILEKSNILFLSSGPVEDRKYEPKNVIMFDDQKGKPIAQLKIGHNIKNIKVNSKRLFIVGRNKIFVFVTNNLSNVGTFDCYENDDEGICELAEEQNEHVVFAYPNKYEGYVNVMIIKDKRTNIKSIHVSSKKISCLSLNKKGDRLLTTATTGNTIKLFNSITGDFLGCFKRGVEKAQIFSLNFSSDDSFISCSSDLGTIQIFKSSDIENTGIDLINNEREKLGKNILDKITDKKSAPRIAKPKSKSNNQFGICKTNEISNLCCFSPNDNIIMVSSTGCGKYYQFEFNQTKGGEIKFSQVIEILCKENLSFLDGGKTP